MRARGILSVARRDGQHPGGRLGARPLVARAYPGTWLFLLAPVVAGLYDLHTLFGLTLLPPGIDPAADVGVNYEVYYYAGEELLAGGNVYDVSPPGETDFYEYLYPPITILAFLPTQLVSPATGYWLFLGVNTVAAGVLTVHTVRYVESLGRPLGWVDVGLVYAFCCLGTQLVTNHFYGNVNLLLATGVGGAIYLLEVGDATPRREAGAGALLAGVALLKLFPALLGLYLLRIRAWWATASALAVGGGGLIAGELVFAVGPFGWDTGDRAYGFGMTERWLREAVLPRGDTAAFVGGLDPGGPFYVTIQRPLSHLLWGVVPGEPGWLTLALLAGALAVGLAVAGLGLRRIERRVDRLVGVLAVTVVAVVVVPSLQYYVALAFLPAIALAYLLEDHPAQPLVVVAGGLLAGAARPEHLLDRLESLPAGLDGLLAPIVATTTTPLLAAGLLLAAAGAGVRYGDGDALPGPAVTARPVGPPLCAWLADRGIGRSTTRGRKDS